MAESYVRPVTSAHEPPPPWRAVWRFRATAFVILALLAVLTVRAVNVAVHAGDQDPTSDTSAPATAPPSP